MVQGMSINTAKLIKLKQPTNGKKHQRLIPGNPYNSIYTLLTHTDIFFSPSQLHISAIRGQHKQPLWSGKGLVHYCKRAAGLKMFSGGCIPMWRRSPPPPQTAGVKVVQ